jgi:hypothetical protein
MRLYISYRFPDKGFVGRLRLHLPDLLPEADVKQSNPVGNIAAIDALIKATDVLMVVIGPNWLGYSRASASLLQSPDDRVRCELTAALKYPHVRIAPLLLEDAQMPAKEDLPAALASFAKINATIIRHTSFDADVTAAIEMLQSSNEESSWSPSIAYGTIRVLSKKQGLVNRYFETDYPPVTIMIDGEAVGTMRLFNRSFEQNVTPGEHVVTIKSADRTISPRECRISVRPGQTTVLNAERNWFLGTISLQPVN